MMAEQVLGRYGSSSMQAVGHQEGASSWPLKRCLSGQELASTNAERRRWLRRRWLRRRWLWRRRLRRRWLRRRWLWEVVAEEVAVEEVAVEEVVVEEVVVEEVVVEEEAAWRGGVLRECCAA
jgi:hypothetical protein